jgi:hypothetical protein
MTLDPEPCSSFDHVAMRWIRRISWQVEERPRFLQFCLRISDKANTEQTADSAAVAPLISFRSSFECEERIFMLKVLLL